MNNADRIENLPDDTQAHVTPDELKILQKYFENKDEGKKLVVELREVLIATIIFALLANPLFDKFLAMVPHMGSCLIRGMVKLFLFFIIFYVMILITNKSK